MTTTAPPDVWKNPYQRFGYVDVNFVIGNGIEESDIDLFFGPIHDTDVTITTTYVSIPRLLVSVGLFSSIKEAERRGYKGLVPLGFSRIVVKQWGRKHVICFLLIPEGVTKQ